jgi:ElaB/YqjD/DUF883 family membrane-anchored ribosome-binding protein
MPHRNHHQEGDSGKGKTLGDKGDSLMTRARDVASNAGQAASDTLASAGQKADEMAASVGSGMESLAGSLERTGRYLKKEGVTGMIEDCGEFISRHPFPTVLFAVGFGFLLARALSGR